MKTLKLFLALICVALLANASFAQQPGDGIPDIYCFGFAGTIPTSAGDVTRPAGTVLVDTDGQDMVALLIEGPNIFDTTPDDGNWLFGSTARLPDPNASPPLFSSDWTTGYIAGKSQWVRTNPLDTDGFVGVIGEYGDPFEIFPDLGVGRFISGSGGAFDVIFATSESGTFASNPEPGQMQMSPLYGCIPEPATTSLLGLAILGMLVGRRR